MVGRRGRAMGMMGGDVWKWEEGESAGRVVQESARKVYGGFTLIYF